MRVLVADKFEDIGLNGLKDLGMEVIYEPSAKEDVLAEKIHETGAQILVVRSTKVNEGMMQGSSLGLIIRAGAGYNNIDVKAASQLGIFVSNCPGKNSFAVAELAFGLIIACDRHIAECASDMKAGKWNKKKYSNSMGLNGRTLGLIGMGMIGQAMVPRAKAFGMNVAAYSRWMRPDVAAALGIGRAESPIEIARQCDVVSVHVSLTPDTKGILGKEFFDAMKPGAIFVNTSRAEVVDQAALIEAAKSGRIRVGLDVFEGEPTEGECDFDGEIKDVPNVICTHHIGASTEEAQTAVALEVINIAREYRATGLPLHTVNVPTGDQASHVIAVRHADKVGVLASILGALKDEGVNVQEMENIILAPSFAAIAQISVAKEPSPNALQQMKMNPNVFDVQVLAAEG